jgi:hypothetical protein
VNIEASHFVRLFGGNKIGDLTFILFIKPEAAITVFELLMMGGVSPETC